MSSDDGDVIVLILPIGTTLSVIMDVLSVIMTKQKLDSAADQVTRQIRLAGKVDADTTDASGKVHFTLVPFGSYTFHISKTGYDPGTGSASISVTALPSPSRCI